MRGYRAAKIFILNAVSTLLFSLPVFGQGDVVKSDGIANPLHRENLGRIVFTTKPPAAADVTEADFLKSFELDQTGDLAFRAFMGNSLTNYLHRLSPVTPADQLTQNGNYQFSFFVDGRLVHKENLHPAAISKADKDAKTIFGVSFINSSNPESRWGGIWHRFMLNGGWDALTAGKHLLRIEIRPYVRNTELKVGELIASGELQITVVKPKIDEKSTQVRTIDRGSGWQIYKGGYDTEKIRELKSRITEDLYKQITSIVVIKDGKLLIEEYFNGATRETLHNTRSVGKSFASTMMGIAINEGHIKSEHQTLKDFYDLTKFANHSAKKESVTLESLLTMSSGFDGNDDEEDSLGNEEKMYPTGDWIKFTLDLPMDQKKEVGGTFNYFTAGVVVLGDIINKSVPGGLEKFAELKLFKPLGITKYRWQYTPQKVPSTAGGLQMNALDFAKYGQLYKNGGVWNRKQIAPRGWVDKTFTKHGGRDYGYLFWHSTFNVNGSKYEAFHPSGNGGNKIYIFKDQPLVVVVTATAYGKWYMHLQVNSMMESYILPAIVSVRPN